jgi:hypothetical protein
MSHKPMVRSGHTLRPETIDRKHQAEHAQRDKPLSLSQLGRVPPIGPVKRPRKP